MAVERWPNAGVPLMESGVPGAGDGSEGTYYFDTDTDTLYGPKTGVSWPVVGVTGVGFIYVGGQPGTYAPAYSGVDYLYASTNYLFGPYNAAGPIRHARGSYLYDEAFYTEFTQNRWLVDTIYRRDTSKQDVIAGLTASGAELNILDGATVLTAELNYVGGVTSPIQTQLDAKAASMGVDDNYVTDAEKTVIGNTSGTNTGDNATNSQYSGLAASKQDTITGLTASGAELNILDGATLSTVELNYVDGVTSAIQTQMNAKLDDSQASAYGLTLLDDANAAAARTTLGLGAVNDTADTDKPISDLTQIALDAKNDTLVSGTNIKTINGSPVLGAGDLVVSGGPGVDENYVTDAQLIVIGNTSGTNTGDNATNSQYSGLAASKQDVITGLTSSAAELNILDGATLSTTELNYVDGVTSAIQTQLDAKLDDSQATAFGLSQLDDADAAAGRATLGLGTLATQSGTFSGTSSGTNTGDNTNFAAPLGADDNYVTDAEKTVIGNTSGTNTGDNATNSQYSGLTSGAKVLLIAKTTFTAVTSVSLAADSFTSTYDSYELYITITAATLDTFLRWRAREAGADYTGTFYDSGMNQALVGASTNTPVGVTGQNGGNLGYLHSTVPSQTVMQIHNINLGMNTQVFHTHYGRNLAASGWAVITGGTNLRRTTQYDALTFYSSAAITGTYILYGITK